MPGKAATLPEGISEAMFADLYRQALQMASEPARTHDEKELLHDAATDGLIWARDNWKPNIGPFAHFAIGSVKLALSRAVAQTMHRDRRRPGRLSLNHELPNDEDGTYADTIAAPKSKCMDSNPLPLELRDAPKEIQDAVLLFLIHGYQFRDCGLLLGVAAETVRLRLVQAAKLLAPDAALPSRKNGERRLQKVK